MRIEDSDSGGGSTQLPSSRKFLLIVILPMLISISAAVIVDRVADIERNIIAIILILGVAWVLFVAIYFFDKVVQIWRILRHHRWFRKIVIAVVAIVLAIVMTVQVGSYIQHLRFLLEYNIEWRMAGQQKYLYELRKEMEEIKGALDAIQEKLDES